MRKDLDHSYRMVQGAHAVAQYLIDFPQSDWNNQTLIFLLVDNEEHLKSYEQKLLIKGITEYSKFYEPDIGNQLTSIAVYTDEKIFKRLSLA